MKGVQCYELFGGIALKIHTFSFFSFSLNKQHEAEIQWEEVKNFKRTHRKK